MKAATPRSPHFRVTFGSNAIILIPPNRFALAARLHFMLSGHVAFPEHNCLLQTCVTKILAQRVEKLDFVELANTTKGDALSMNS